MRIAVISTQNTLLSGAITRYLRERGELLPERVTNPDEVYDTALALNAAVVLMEVSRLPSYSLKRRLDTVRRLHDSEAACKTALLCDENADQALAEQVKDAKKAGLIDCFFYSSVSGEYLTAMLDSL